MSFFFKLLTFLFLLSSRSCFQAKSPGSSAGKTCIFVIRGLSVVAPVKAVDDVVMEPIVALHANSIAVMPYAFMSAESAEVRYSGHKQHWGETMEGIKRTIQMAHLRHLSVMVKPHLWIARGTYTGSLALKTEEEWQLWEESYRKYILGFAALADTAHAEIFCIGTELNGTIKHRPFFWKSLIDSIKAIYHGKITYAANWDDYPNVQFWDKMDYIGIDAYFPLVEDKTPSVAALKQAWQKHLSALESISVRYIKPILFTEYGYRNTDYAAAEPWKEGDGILNHEAQANAFEAFFQILSRKKWFAGGYVWKWYLDEVPIRRSAIDFTPQNKPAKQVIQRWYSFNQ